MIKKIVSYTIRLVLGILVILFALLALDPTELSVDDSGLSELKEKTNYEHTADVLYETALQKKYGRNKRLPRKLELATLRALSHYPELKDTPIDFLFVRSDLELQSRPEPLSVLLPWRERRYQVLISVELPDDLKGAALSELPYNAQIGVLGHELAHTVSYLDKSSLSLTWMALNYFFSADFRQEFERATDVRTIKHKLKPQLKEWSIAVHDKLEKMGRGKNYLTPAEIEAIP